MSNIVVVASFKVREDAVDRAVDALTPCIEATHQEDGCISYALHRNAYDPQNIVLVERWESKEALEAHQQQPHVAALGAQAGEFLAEPPVIQFLSPTPVGDPAKAAL